MTSRMILATLSAALVAPVAIAQQATTTTTRTQEIPATPRRANVSPPQEAVPAQDAASRRIGANQAQPAATGRKMAVDDNLFLMAAGLGGMAEVKLSELGLQKATDPELKQLSQRAIDDHTHANQAIAALAAKRNLTLPAAAGPKEQFCLQSLTGLSGEEFDRCYAKAQFLVHMDAVATFEAEAERGRDPQVKALAAKLLPTIKEHLAMVKPIAMKAMQAEQQEPDAPQDATAEPAER
jgi:putative membrane protein